MKHLASRISESREELTLRLLRNLPFWLNLLKERKGDHYV